MEKDSLNHRWQAISRFRGGTNAARFPGTIPEPGHAKTQEAQRKGRLPCGSQSQVPDQSDGSAEDEAEGDFVIFINSGVGRM